MHTDKSYLLFTSKSVFIRVHSWTKDCFFFSPVPLCLCGYIIHLFRPWILAVFFFFAFVPQVFAEDFTIERFHSDITIREDSSFTVTETLVVRFHRPRHGIYREIPYRYGDMLGKDVTTPLRILSVTDESGGKWKYKVSRPGNVVNVRIGDPDKYVSGLRTYVITYDVDNALLFFDDHDELYWNVTGNEWKVPILEASSAVNLAVKEKSKEYWASCYTGVYGSTEAECLYDTSHNIGEFFSKKKLKAGEGFTIAFGWDKGLVSPPSAWKKFLWKVNPDENWIFLLPLFSVVFMINHWRKKGRDPSVRESITVMYGPPEHSGKPLAPAEVGTLVDETLDSRDITATIVGLAVKGYIRIEETKKGGLIFDTTDYYLAKVKDPDDNLGPFETVLMSRLFAGDAPGVTVSELKNRFYKNLDTLKGTLYSDLVSKKYFNSSPEKVRMMYFVTGLVCGLAGLFLSAVLLPEPMKLKGIFSSLLIALPVVGLAKHMPAKTKSGSAARIEVLGFEEFMNRAEKDRIERMGDKDLFSKFLPYAIALDVADNWAGAFEGIYQNPPEWYTAPGGFRTFSPRRFTGSLSSMTSSLATALYSAPRSSGTGGGSGGGSSGGGFGGGGGGSW